MSVVAGDPPHVGPHLITTLPAALGFDIQKQVVPGSNNGFPIVRIGESLRTQVRRWSSVSVPAITVASFRRESDSWNEEELLQKKAVMDIWIHYPHLIELLGQQWRRESDLLTTVKETSNLIFLPDVDDQSVLHPLEAVMEGGGWNLDLLDLPTPVNISVWGKDDRVILPHPPP